MIGIIGAMDIEVKDLLAVMEGETSEAVSGILYHTGKIGGADCAVAQCGIGKVAAAVCAQTMILKFNPSALINVGVAGGIGSEIHIGDVVVSSGLVQHDMDTSALGDPKGMISGINLIKIPASRHIVDLVASTAKEIYGAGKVHVGVIATGDQFISAADKLKKLAADFGASACEMEGGSIAQVCYLNKTDFAVIRAISDNADEEAGTDFTVFAENSAREITDLILSLLPKLTY